MSRHVRDCRSREVGIIRAAVVRWLRLALIALAILAPTAMHSSTARAQLDDYTLSAVLQNSPFFPPDGWVPLRCELRNTGDQSVDGYVEIPVENEAGGVAFRMPVHSPAHSKVIATAYAYFAAPAPKKDPSAGVPSITTAAWYTSDAARLTRVQVLGQPIGTQAPGATEKSPKTPGPAQQQQDLTSFAGTTLMLTIQGENAGDSRDSYDTFGFGKFLSNMLGVAVGPAFLSENYAPHNRVGFFPCRIVCFDDTSADALDMAQRTALLDYLTGGGVLILPAPLGRSDPTDSWIRPYFPVQTIGHREAKRVDSMLHGKKVSLKLHEPVEICEAVPGDAQVVLGDEKYCHAAYKRVGLGRVVFTSFPINSLDPNDENANAVWRELIGADAPTSDWQQSQLADRRVSLLEAMVGKPTVPWKWAAGVAGGYLLVMLAIQSFVGVGKRPGAFITGSIIATGVSLVLVTMTLVQRHEEKLVGARLATLDLAPGGGGIQREVFTYLGRDLPDMSLSAARQDVTIRPVVAAPGDPPVVWLHPFKVPRAGAHAAKMDRVWQADGVLPVDQSVEASAMFGPEGLQISVDNRFGQPLRGPLLVWGEERFSLKDLADGKSEALAGSANRNISGDFTNVSVIASQQDKLRGEILKAAVTPPSAFTAYTASSLATPPLLAAWIDSAPSLTNSSGADPPPDVQSQALARAPVALLPSPVGTQVKIDGAFTRIDLTDARGLPYDTQKHEWIASPQEGTYLFCFTPPPQIGKLRPTRATIEVDVRAPKHDIVLRRGQCIGRNGEPQENPSGMAIAHWSQPIEHKTVTFACEPTDFDSRGRTWIWMQVQNPSLNDAMPSSWHFNQFELGMEAEVIGAPVDVRPRVTTTSPVANQDNAE